MTDASTFFLKHAINAEDALITDAAAVYSAAKALLDAQATDSPREHLRTALAQAYARFEARHGLFHDKPARAALATHPAYPFLLTLATPAGKRSALFARDIVAPARALPDTATPTDALAISLDVRNAVDLDLIERLSRLSRSQVLDALAGRIFKLPGVGHWVTRDEYLSGDVRAKLAQAKAHLDSDPAMLANIDALEGVQPAPLMPNEIHAGLGAPWIPTDIFEAFFTHLAPASGVAVARNSALGTYYVTVTRGRNQLRAGGTWSTPDSSTDLLFLHALNGKAMQELADNIMIDRMQDEFSRWAWADEARAKRLATIYNATQNTIAPRRFDGAHQTFPGLNTQIKLRPHQLNAIWRAKQCDRMLLADKVGFGKTLVMIVSAMEMRRLSIAKTVAIVVPNSVVEQWRDEVLRAYPGCNVLVCDRTSFAPDRRQQFLAQIASGDFDIVLIAMSQFRSIPVSRERLVRHTLAEINSHEQTMQQLYENNNRSQYQAARKDMLKTIRRLEAKLERIEASTDDTDGLTWDDLGIDCLMIDEADEYSNLKFATQKTSITGLSNSDSERASDMYLKIRAVQECGGRTILATATPARNTIAQVFTMMRLLQPDELERQNWSAFDAWAAANARAQLSQEISPEGRGLQHKFAFTKFVNVPELSKRWGLVLHRTRDEEVSFDQPQLSEPILIQSEPCPITLSFMKSLSARAAAVRSGGVDPSEDNLLAIMSDGRKAALDISMVVPGAPAMQPGSKLAKLCDTLATVRAASGDYGVQLVFLDMGTPKASSRATESDGDSQTESDDDLAISAQDAKLTADAYALIRRGYIERGFSGDEIAFIHDAKSSAARSQLFADVRAGIVRVLIGSTGKMGAGVNVQNRVCAIHHVDIAWRPRDMTQRNGRAFRQGNSYNSVLQFVYITKQSLDAVMWQVVARKERSLNQLLDGTIQARNIEDVGATVLSYEQIKSAATGDLRMMRKARVDAQIVKLSALRSAWVTAQHMAAKQLESASVWEREWRAGIKRLTDEIAKRDASAGAQFESHLVAKIGISQSLMRFDQRADADAHLSALIEASRKYMADQFGTGYHKSQWIAVGEYRGYTLSIKATNTELPVVIALSSGPDPDSGYVSATPTHAGIDNTLKRMESKIAELEDKIATLQTQIPIWQSQIDTPFADEPALHKLEAESAALGVILECDLSDAQKLERLRSIDETLTLDSFRDDESFAPRVWTTDEIAAAIREATAAAIAKVSVSAPATDKAPAAAEVEKLTLRRVTKVASPTPSPEGVLVTVGVAAIGTHAL